MFVGFFWWRFVFGGDNWNSCEENNVLNVERGGEELEEIGIEYVVGYGYDFMCGV